MHAYAKSLLAICAGLIATAVSADDDHKSFAELGAKPHSSQSFNFSDGSKDDGGKSWQSQSIPKLDTNHGASWSHGVPTYGKQDFGKGDFGQYDFGKHGYDKPGYDWQNYENCSPIPEPSTYAMMALGLLGVGFYARRRKAG